MHLAVHDIDAIRAHAGLVQVGAENDGRVFVGRRVLFVLGALLLAFGKNDRHETLHQFLGAERGRGGEFGIDWNAGLLKGVLHGASAVGEEIDFVEDDEFTLGGKRRRTTLEFAADGAIVLHKEEGIGVAAFRGVGAAHIDHVQEDAAALDVAEELVAKALALAGAFDKARNVTEDERAVADRDDAEVGDERREGIVGDFWPGPADDGDECRLADVREADDADVGDELQFERDP